VFDGRWRRREQLMVCAIVITYLATVAIPPAAAGEGPRVKLGQMRSALEDLGYRCKMGSDVPETFRPPEPHKIFCYRGGVKTTGIAVDVEADKADVVSQISVDVETGYQRFTPEEAAGWFAEIARIAFAPRDRVPASAWIRRAVVANKNYAAQRIGGVSMAVRCEYDIPHFYIWWWKEK
jgi:hypothetical protein